MESTAMTDEPTPRALRVLRFSAMKQPLTSSSFDGKNGVSVRTCRFANGLSSTFFSAGSVAVRFICSKMQLLAALLDLASGDRGKGGLCGSLLNQFRDSGDGYETRILHILIRKLHVELRFDFCDELDDLHRGKQSYFKIVDVDSGIALSVDFASIPKPIF